MNAYRDRRSAPRNVPCATTALTLLIAERVAVLARRRHVPQGRELELWLEAEAEVKRELGAAS